MKKVSFLILITLSYLHCFEDLNSIEYYYNNQNEANIIILECDNTLISDKSLEIFTKCLNAYGGILAAQYNNLELAKKQILPFINAYKWHIQSQDENLKNQDYYEQNPQIAKEVYRNCFYSYLNSSKLNEIQKANCEKAYLEVQKLQTNGDDFKVTVE